MVCHLFFIKHFAEKMILHKKDLTNLGENLRSNLVWPLRFFIALAWSFSHRCMRIDEWVLPQSWSKIILKIYFCPYGFSRHCRLRRCCGRWSTEGEWAVDSGARGAWAGDTGMWSSHVNYSRRVKVTCTNARGPLGPNVVIQVLYITCSWQVFVFTILQSPHYAIDPAI